MKTIQFTTLFMGWDIRIQQIVHSKIVGNHACNPNLLFLLQMEDKLKKLPKMMSKGVPKMYQQSIKSILGPSRVHLCASMTHLIAKRCPNGAQGSPKGPQMVI